MFKLNRTYEVNISTLKCDYNNYSPSQIGKINTANSQIYNDIPREDSVISLLNSYLDLIFDLVHAATNNRYADGIHIKLVNLETSVLFSIYKLTTSSGQHLEDISHAHIVGLMFTFFTSARGSDDFSIGFDRDQARRQREMTNNENQKGKNLVRVYSRDISGFAELQEKVSFGLGYKLTLTKIAITLF